MSLGIPLPGLDCKRSRQPAWQQYLPRFGSFGGHKQRQMHEVCIVPWLANTSAQVLIIAASGMSCVQVATHAQWQPDNGERCKKVGANVTSKSQENQGTWAVS